MDKYVVKNWKCNITLVDPEWYEYKQTIITDHVNTSTSLERVLDNLLESEDGKMEKPTSLYIGFTTYFHKVAKAIESLREKRCLSVEFFAQDVNDVFTHLLIDAKKRHASQNGIYIYIRV